MYSLKQEIETGLNLERLYKEIAGRKPVFYYHTHTCSCGSKYFIQDIEVENKQFICPYCGELQQIL